MDVLVSNNIGSDELMYICFSQCDSLNLGDPSTKTVKVSTLQEVCLGK